MSKIHELEQMNRFQRRRFLKLLGVALSAPQIPAAFRYACADVVGGSAAAQAATALTPSYFLEVNLRDQWDNGHVFVAPGLATNANLKRGENLNYAALYYQSGELKTRNNRVYLTNDSIALDPHLDTIAMIDTGEVFNGGIHGHEAANALRSPGRDYNMDNGRKPMYENDPRDEFGGNEQWNAITPTPAAFHNYIQKKLDPTLRNGIAFKGLSRTKHTIYHYGAGLAGAELDRIKDKDSLFGHFPATTQDLNILPTKEESLALVSVLNKVDERFLRSQRIADGLISDHQSKVRAAQQLLYSGATKTLSLPLTADEQAYWKQGVPDQVYISFVKAQIWEQFAYASKLLTSGMTRSVALEFDYGDTHDRRPEDEVRTEAKQISMPLARIIKDLKDAGIYDKTLIAAYTTDGSRQPGGGSTGQGGKNSVILAGGMIKGGYYGDIRVAKDLSDGHEYSYHAPDPTTGQPGAGNTGSEARTSGASIWRTVMKALQVPDSECDAFSPVKNVKPLSFLLR